MRLKRSVRTVILLSVFMTIAGCAEDYREQETVVETAMAEGAAEDDGDSAEICAEIEERCRDIYETFKESNGVQSLERMEMTLKRLGEAGYTAVDQDNQFDMENPVLAEEFCEKVKEKQGAELLLIVALNNGGFVQFHFETENGAVNVLAESLFWKEEGLVIDPVYTDRFQAEEWIYTENGYLFFEKHYMDGFSGPYGHVAVRVKPLDGICRELNRSYILPLGYGSNNLFLTDWDEKDYGDVDFYDIFERLYQKYGVDITGDLSRETEGGGTVYQIPEDDFEKVIMGCFSVSSEELRKRARYSGDMGTYEYRPRGFYEIGSNAELPYPEVVAYEKREDGIMELTVNAVWPEGNTESVFQHKVAVRLLGEGKFQYVSNQIVSEEYHGNASWYVERLDDERWEEYYGE